MTAPSVDEVELIERLKVVEKYILSGNQSSLHADAVADAIAAMSTRSPSVDEVEAVARAIAKADGKDPDALSHNSFQWWRHYVPQARAAIAAMSAAANPPVGEET